MKENEDWAVDIWLSVSLTNTLTSPHTSREISSFHVFFLTSKDYKF